MELLEREPMLEVLQDLLVQSRRTSGRLALVVGEAGIGKTSLVEAFCRERRSNRLVLWGRCDAVTPPRPFAPLLDIAEASESPLRAALDAADRDAVYTAVLDLLRGASPPVIVLEDLHWADEATLDLLRVVGRRLPYLHALIVATFRDHDVAPDHPLRLALGDLPAGVALTIPVPLLTVAAVDTLAHGTGIDPVALHRTTAGNPFFITEVIHAGHQTVPGSVRDAVLARAARLPPPAQQVLQAASVLGQDCDAGLLLAVARDDESAIEECLARGLLNRSQGRVGFRHELAQRAVLEGIPPAHRATWHRRALEELRQGVTPADPARLAHHAERAGDSTAILELAPAAGHRAAELGAHREAAAHFGLALRFAGQLPPQARAELLEAHARECRLADDVSAGLASQEAALAYWRAVGDEVREADGLQAKSTLLWHAGQSDDAVKAASAAVAMLERVAPKGQRLAWARAVLAQLVMVTGYDDVDAFAHAERALQLADELGDEEIAVHALTTRGVIEVYSGADAGWVTLEESLRRARAADLGEAATRSLINLVEAAIHLRRYDLADQYIASASAQIEPYQFDLLTRILRGRIADLAFDRGKWDEAAAEARALIDQQGTAGRIRTRALILLGRLAVRRGEPEAWSLLEEALRATGTADVQEFVPLQAACAEAAWLDHDHSRAAAEAQKGLQAANLISGQGWWAAELAFWAWKAGSQEPVGQADSDPFALHRAGRYRDAAAAWRSLGCPYEQGLALGDSDDLDDLREALAIFHGLGAAPMATRVTDRLRAKGASSIPRGPRAATATNPWRLTSRELEVLTLLGQGLHNRDIARRLVLSTKTVDHHVSAILKKMGVTKREDAAAAAARHGGKDGQPSTAT